MSDFQFVVGDTVRTKTTPNGPTGLIRYRKPSQHGPVYAVFWRIDASQPDIAREIAVRRNQDDNGNSLRWLESSLEKVVAS